MAPADAEDHFAFISFDCCFYALTMLVAHFSAYIRGVDGWPLTGCELVPHHLIIPVQALIPRHVMYDAFGLTGVS